MQDPKSDALNRRDAMKLISAVAALGAGLSVYAKPAGAAPGEAEKIQYSIKLYKEKVEKGAEDELVHSVDIPQEIGQKLFKYESLQMKLFKDSNIVIGSGKITMTAIKTIAPK